MKFRRSVSVPLDDDDLENLDEICRKDDAHRTDVMRAALRQYATRRLGKRRKPKSKPADDQDDKAKEGAA